MRPKNTPEGFWMRVDQSGGLFACWPWTGSVISTGYGNLSFDGRYQLAHRVSYQLTSGAVPAGLELDHLCRNPVCVNPAHLEAVTHRENIHRGVGWGGRHARAAACPTGHPYDEANTGVKKNGRRFCRACSRTRSSAYYHAKSRGQSNG